MPGLVDLKSSAKLGNPELQIAFQRDQLVKLGLDLTQVAAVVRGKVQGDVATRFTDADRQIDILVRSVDRGEASVEEVADLIVGQRKVGGTRQIQERTESGFFLSREVAAGPGETVPIRLKTIADITLAEGPSEIRRIGQKRAAVISANLHGRDMAGVAADVKRIVDGASLPLGTLAVLGGQQEEMARSMRSLMLAIALAIFLVYLVMAAEFESFLHPLVIMFSVPLGGIGVVFALYLTGTTVNVVAMIGIVMLAGIVVNNAIVLIDAVNRLRREEGYAKRDALLEAARSRLRPILMTTATTVLGLVPMALGLGEGAELRTPLAITVIGGLSVATLLTLIIIPVVYTLMDREKLPADLGARRRRRAKNRAGHPAARAPPCAPRRPEDERPSRSFPTRRPLRPRRPRRPRSRRFSSQILGVGVYRPIATTMLLISVVIFGAIAMERLPLALLPEVDVPFIGIEVPYEGSNPMQVEREITKPIEEVLGTLSGIKKLSSTSKPDGAEFQLEFDWGQDLDIVRMQVEREDGPDQAFAAGGRGATS